MLLVMFFGSALFYLNCASLYLSLRSYGVTISTLLPLPTILSFMPAPSILNFMLISFVIKSSPIVLRYVMFPLMISWLIASPNHYL